MKRIPTRLFATLLAATACASFVGAVKEAGAQPLPNGFQLDRYEPTMPGAWFLSVEHPWYSSTRYFGAALTLDYGHDPLVYGLHNPDDTFTRQQVVVEHQLMGHLDLAASLADRLNLGLSLPVSIYDAGPSACPASCGDASAHQGAFKSIGDPRLSIYARLWGQPDKDAFSVHLAGSLWFPVGADGKHDGDSNFRGAPKLLFAGLVADHIRYSASIAYLLRYAATIGSVPPSGSTIGQELQLGLAAQYTDKERKWAIGPELVIGTVTNDPGNLNTTTFFGRDYTSIELSGSFHYMVANQLLVSAAVGVGLLRTPGTPDVRALARIAWSPERARDRDEDGIPDVKDACPDVRGVRDADPKMNGCPPDRDRDGVADELDLCPDVPRGDHPDLARVGCPIGDRDKDGVFDWEDECVEVPAGDKPDPAHKGCPLPDRDGDGVVDPEDVCPDLPAGDKPDPDKKGCPFVEKPAPRTDRDGDGVFDDEDLCPDVPMGLSPDPDKRGCPLPDRDGDKIPDKVDACPDKPGAPDTDPKKNGCPGLVMIKDCKIDIAVPVFFATDKDVILPKSFPVLTSVANAFKVSPLIKRVSVEGHTDAMGKRDHNLDLSDRRARSVMNWLVGKGGITAGRLESHGYGPDRPIADNKTAIGRAKNRRVEFRILEPHCDDHKEVAPPEPPRPAVKPGKAGKLGKLGKAPKAGKAPKVGKGPKRHKRGR